MIYLLMVIEGISILVCFIVWLYKMSKLGQRAVLKNRKIDKIGRIISLVGFIFYVGFIRFGLMEGQWTSFILAQIAFFLMIYGWYLVYKAFSDADYNPKWLAIVINFWQDFRKSF